MTTMIFWAVIGTGVTVLGSFLAAFGWIMSQMQKNFDSFRAEMRGDIEKLREDMEKLRTEMRADMEKLRTETREDIRDLRADIKEVNKSLTKIEKRLVALEHPAVSA